MGTDTGFCFVIRIVFCFVLLLGLCFVIRGELCFVIGMGSVLFCYFIFVFLAKCEEPSSPLAYNNTINLFCWKVKV